MGEAGDGQGDASRGAAGASSTRTVTYCVEGGQLLAMTLFIPGTPGSSHPVVLEVHGGGWQHGGRLLSLSGSGAATDLVGAGFVVASIDYGLAPLDPRGDAPRAGDRGPDGDHPQLRP